MREALLRSVSTKKKKKKGRPDAEEAEELVIYAFFFSSCWNSMRGGESTTPDSSDEVHLFHKRRLINGMSDYCASGGFQEMGV